MVTSFDTGVSTCKNQTKPKQKQKPKETGTTNHSSTHILFYLTDIHVGSGEQETDCTWSGKLQHLGGIPGYVTQSGKPHAGHN